MHHQQGIRHVTDEFALFQDKAHRLFASRREQQRIVEKLRHLESHLVVEARLLPILVDGIELHIGSAFHFLEAGIEGLFATRGQRQENGKDRTPNNKTFHLIQTFRNQSVRLQTSSWRKEGSFRQPDARRMPDNKGCTARPSRLSTSAARLRPSQE